ncbi:Maf family protein [Psychrobacter sp. B38]|uniref:Maf family protein n=1 Tax=Psychrobacter sp. B38 TaxID=3143538 RepID=UPI00320CBFC0
MDIILASGSPRRRELLSRVQLDFSLLSVDIDETQYDNELPKDYIERMVATKAQAAVHQLNETHQTSKESSAAPLAEQLIVITADTIGVLPDGKTVLVKPTDREHAYRMWQQMSDNTHEVWTAVQVSKIALLPVSSSLSDESYDVPDQERCFQMIHQRQITERTEVNFIPLTTDMMSDYWDSGEPADKAGGYGIQGLGAAWVSRINGSYTNVVGLPLAQTLALIKEMR